MGYEKIMGVTAVIVLLLVVVGIIVFAGSQVMSFVTDTQSAIAQSARDIETQIPQPPIGSKICDLIITATWREKNSLSLGDDIHILFTNTDGKSIKKVVNNCGNVLPAHNSLMTLLDFIGTKQSVTPLDLIIPDTLVFESEYKMSFVLVDENGLEKKLPRYQEISYKIPALKAEYDFEQKIIFRDVAVGDYILELRPINAKWNDHGEHEPYKQKITVP